MSPAAIRPPRAPELGWALAGTLAVGLAVALWGGHPAASAALTDWQLRAAAADAPPAGVLVLDIDEATLAELRPRLGAWPYKRDVYALVIEQLRDLGAKAIAIDLLLADAQDGDAALARAIGRPGPPVVLAAAGLRHASDGLPAAAPVPAGGAAPVAAMHWPAMALPAESLWPAAGRPPRWVGVITTPLDADGRLRHLPLQHHALGRDWPAFPLAVLEATGGAAAAWPLDAQGRVTIPFPVEPRHEPQALPFVRVARLALGGAADAELAAAVQGRVVFIGSSAQLADNVLTPGGQWRGTAVLAHAYAALRDGRLARDAPAWTVALLIALGALPVALAWQRRATAPRREALLTLVLAAAVAALGHEVARTRLELIALAPALATLAAGFAFALAAHLRATGRQQRELAYEGALADASNRAKSEFLANVSHEIRTPMNAVMGVAELLAHSPLDAQQRRHVEVLQQSGRALLELIDDLLDLAKIEAGRVDVERAPFALRPTLEALVALFGPRAQGKGLALALDVADGVPAAALGDRRRVSQVLTNLLGNAIKFTAQGEVRLAVARGDGERVVFVVSDSGIGIAASKLGTIFEPFMQADGSVTRRFGGTGLGLAITRRLVEYMGGAIVAESHPGQGSRFTVTLPLPPVALGEVTLPIGLRGAEPADAAAAAIADEPALPARRLAILLAEDNPTNVYLFEAMLSGLDVVIDVADNGHRAVERFERQAYDVVFLDVQMPVLDGHGAARAMRRLEAEQGRARTPIVALTAHAYAQDERASLAAGCDAHLTKPIARATLIATLWRLAGTAAPATGVPVSVAAPAADVIDERGAVGRLGGNEALYARACEHAGVFIAGWSAAFEQALHNDDAEQARRLAHDLKSISATIGAQHLSDAARELEAAFGRPPVADRAALDAPAHAVREALGAALLALDRRRAA
ncbi:MAG TPA: CHASE2 domain-containing protein [Burkholderiaceae bacterium]|nr:CHASE2 domain-containing protein [Burkholderiaceae bacterium]